MIFEKQGSNKAYFWVIQLDFLPTLLESLTKCDETM